MMNPTHFTPRHRRWAARLILLVACLGAVASSPPQSPDVGAEYEASPASLTTDAPMATRHVMIRVSAEEPLSESVEVVVRAEFTVRWRPTDPSSTVKPWFLARLSPFSDDGLDPRSTVAFVLEPSGQPETGQTGGIFVSPPCTPERVCELDLLVAFELQPNAVAGTVEVDWKVSAAAHVVGETQSPKGFALQLLEN